MSEEVKRYASRKCAMMGGVRVRSNGMFVRYDDYAALRAKLVKAVIYIARMWMTHGASVESIVNGALDDHGIRLRWTGDGFEEDKG